jgi:sporulation protein YlmC with PRC-barrel domain
MLRTGDLRGLEVIDADGRTIGVVSDTVPLDGGGEPELALVRVGARFARMRYLPIRAAWIRGHAMHVPWSKWQIDDAPSADDRRWGDPAQIAAAYWVLADD